jgi:hypothetical protein
MAKLEEVVSQFDNNEIKTAIKVLNWAAREQQELNATLNKIIKELAEIKKIVSEEIK